MNKRLVKFAVELQTEENSITKLTSFIKACFGLFTFFFRKKVPVPVKYE